MEITGESIIESNELVSEIISTGSNGSKNDISINGLTKVEEDVVLEAGTINITLGWVVFLAALSLSSDGVEPEPSQDVSNSISEGIA